MTKHDFIFSYKFSHRIKRHLVFWIAFGFTFTIQSLGDPLGGFFNKDLVLRALQSALCFLPFCIISVYVLSYVLFPVFLQKKKYAAFISGFILLVALGLWFNYYATILFFQLNSIPAFTRAQNLMVDANFVWSAIVAGGLALGIKLAKNYYQQQNENLLLAKQKALTELKLLKARIHPDFLFATLDDIYKKIRAGSQKSPLMILKLSEILSYLLYESDEELVPLERELVATNDFISLSKLTIADKQISLKIIGNAKDKFIAPLLLLTTFQNSFSVLFADGNEKFKTGIIISIEDALLMLSLALEYGDKSGSHARYLKSFIESEQRRLNLLYPENNCVLGLSLQENHAELNLIISLNTSILPAENGHRNNFKKKLYEAV